MRHTLSLPCGEIVVLEGGKRRELVCAEGCLWLSVAGCDISLCAGERWCQSPHCKDRVIIEALRGTARLSIAETAPRWGTRIVWPASH